MGWMEMLLNFPAEHKAMSPIEESSQLSQVAMIATAKLALA
jgi:hypothetical protein